MTSGAPGGSGHVQVVGDPDDGGGDVQVVGRFGDLRAHARRHPGAGLGRGTDPRQVAVGGHQRGGRLLADAGDAGQPVGRIAAQHCEVDVRGRVHAVFGLDDGVGDDLETAHAAGRVDDAHGSRVVDDLEEIAIAGDDVDGTVRAGGQRADHIVGFVVGGADRRHSQGGQHVADDRNLRGQLVRDVFDIGAVGECPGDAMRLVGGEQRGPPARSPRIVPARHDTGGAVRAHELRDDVEQPAHRIDGCPVGCGDGCRHAVEGSEVQRGGVQQHDGSDLGHALSVTRAPHRR